MRRTTLATVLATSIGAALAVSAGLTGCSSSTSSTTTDETPVLDGVYVNESDSGDVASYAFSTDGKYVAGLTACDGPGNDYDSDNGPSKTQPTSNCLATGTYKYDATAGTLSLTDDATHKTTMMAFKVTDTVRTPLENAGLATQDLVHDGGALVCAGSTTGTAGPNALVVRAATINGTSFSTATSSDGGTNAAANPTGGSINTLVDSKYSQGSNWTIVYNAVYKKISMDTAPCATFMSTALHTFGGINYPGTFGSSITPTTFPVDPRKTSGIDRIVTPSVAAIHGASFQLQANTSGLATFLMQNHWNIVWSADNLRPGDVVFVVPADWARHPAHTYMFHQWVDQCAGFAYVIDNEADAYCDPTDPGFYGYCGAGGSGTVLCCSGQGQRMYKRNIKVTTPEPKDMDEQDEKMWFALRSPL